MRSRPRDGYGMDIAIAAELTGWPTASTMDSGNTGTAWEERRERVKANHPPGHNGFGLLLPMAAQLSGWPTGTATDASKRGTVAARPGMMGLSETVPMAAWPSPGASDGNGGKGPRKGVSPTGRMPDGSKVTMDLSAATKLALSGWPTPRTVTGGAESAERKQELGRTTSGGGDLQAAALDTIVSGPARLTDSGDLLIGSDAGTRSGGQLSPIHSLWLMLGPFATAWASCGERVTRSRSARRKGSSKRSGKA